MSYSPPPPSCRKPSCGGQAGEPLGYCATCEAIYRRWLRSRLEVFEDAGPIPERERSADDAMWAVLGRSPFE